MSDKVEALLEMLKASQGERSEDDERVRRAQRAGPEDVQAAVLKDMLPLVLAPCPYKAGDLVKQRPEFSRYRYCENLAIVSEVFAEPHRNDEGSGRGGPYTRDDMLILILAKDEWVEFEVESWRFKPYEGKIA